MATRKIGPKNLPAIQKLFCNNKDRLEKQQNSLKKKLRDVENELVTVKEGIEWCQTIARIGVKENADT